VSLLLLGLTVVFLPLLIPSGPGNSAPVDGFALAYLLVALLGLYRQRRSLQVPAKAAWGLIVLGSGLALATSADPPLGLLTFLVDLYLLVLLIVIASDLDRRERALRTVLTVWSAASLAWAVLLLGANLHLLHTGVERILLGQTFRDRIASPSGNPNLAASYLAVSCFVLLASPWPASRVARAAGVAVLLWAVDVTGSNGALMGVAGGALVLAFGRLLRAGRTPRQRLGVVGAALLLAVVAACVGLRLVGVPQVGLQQLDTIAASEQRGPFANSLGRLNRSVRERLVLWESGWQHGGPRVLTGLGPGEAIDVVVNAQGGHQGLHNDAISYAIERGVLGLLGLLALYLALFGAGGVLLLAPGRGRDAYRGLAAAAVTNLLFSQSHETLHFRHVFVLFALVWVAARVVAERDRRAPDHPAGPAAPNAVAGAAHG
jgi:O-antigen ligase